MIDLINYGFIFGFFVPILIGFYIFYSWAYMDIGKRAKVKNFELAWIPFVGPIIIAYLASGMDWWPWLLLAGYFVPIAGIVAPFVFSVYVIIWTWEMFEKSGRAGWLSILTLIPVVNFIVLGIVAWGE